MKVTSMSASADEILRRHRLSVDDFHCMGEAGIFDEDSRVELIDGEIIDMAPIGSAHAGTVMQLSRLFNQSVGGAALVSTQNPILLGDHSEPQPDITLLRYCDDFYKSAHPQPKDVLLIVEVAEASLRYDQEIKIPLYARHRIPEVWLIDLQNNRLIISQSPGVEGYREALSPEDLGRITPLMLPDTVLDLRGLFVKAV